MIPLPHDKLQDSPNAFNAGYVPGDLPRSGVEPSVLLSISPFENSQTIGTMDEWEFLWKITRQVTLDLESEKDCDMTNSSPTSFPKKFWYLLLLSLRPWLLARPKMISLLDVHDGRDCSHWPCYITHNHRWRFLLSRCLDDEKRCRVVSWCSLTDHTPSLAEYSHAPERTSKTHRTSHLCARKVWI